jgi:uncharacterized protein YciI
MESEMHLITLRFGAEKARAAEFMAGHNAWLQRGFDEGAFLASGSLPGGAGGFVLARGLGLEARVEADPFVAEGIVIAEIQALPATRMVPGLEALVA